MNGDSYEDHLKCLQSDIREGLESGEGRLLEDVSVDDIALRGLERLRDMRKQNTKDY
jgi:hypothetical protein